MVKVLVAEAVAVLRDFGEPGSVDSDGAVEEEQGSWCCDADVDARILRCFASEDGLRNVPAFNANRMVD